MMGRFTTMHGDTYICIYFPIGCMIVYDATVQETLDHVSNWSVALSSKYLCIHANYIELESFSCGVGLPNHLFLVKVYNLCSNRLKDIRENGKRYPCAPQSGICFNTQDAHIKPYKHSWESGSTICLIASLQQRHRPRSHRKQDRPDHRGLSWDSR